MCGGRGVCCDGQLRLDDRRLTDATLDGNYTAFYEILYSDFIALPNFMQLP